MTCPDDPAAFLRNAMRHHADHLEPKPPAVGVTESEVRRYKRLLAIKDGMIAERNDELACYRMRFPGFVYSPKAKCLYEKDDSVWQALWGEP